MDLLIFCLRFIGPNDRIAIFRQFCQRCGHYIGQKPCTVCDGPSLMLDRV